MGYRDCPCLKCDHGGEREKRIECRRKMHRICCLETKHAGGKTKEERRQE